MELLKWNIIPYGVCNYLVSNSGLVKRGNRILKPGNPNRYSRVNLSVNGQTKNYMVHRLVAMAFIPNPSGKPYINHKNGIKGDNRVENLEWCTQSENVNHAYKTHLNTATIRPIVQKNGEKIINRYPSVSDAGRDGFNRSHISRCLNGKLKTHHGFSWEYDVCPKIKCL